MNDMFSSDELKQQLNVFGVSEPLAQACIQFIHGHASDDFFRELQQQYVIYFEDELIQLHGAIRVLEDKAAATRYVQILQVIFGVQLWTVFPKRADCEYVLSARLTDAAQFSGDIGLILACYINEQLSDKACDFDALFAQLRDVMRVDARFLTESFESLNDDAKISIACFLVIQNPAVYHPMRIWLEQQVLRMLASVIYSASNSVYPSCNDFRAACSLALEDDSCDVAVFESQFGGVKNGGVAGSTVGCLLLRAALRLADQSLLLRKFLWICALVDTAIAFDALRNDYLSAKVHDTERLCQDLLRAGIPSKYIALWLGSSRDVNIAQQDCSAFLQRYPESGIHAIALTSDLAVLARLYTLLWAQGLCLEKHYDFERSLWEQMSQLLSGMYCSWFEELIQSYLQQEQPCLDVAELSKFDCSSRYKYYQIEDYFVLHKALAVVNSDYFERICFVFMSTDVGARFAARCYFSVPTHTVETLFLALSQQGLNPTQLNQIAMKGVYPCEDGLLRAYVLSGFHSSERVEQLFAYINTQDKNQREMWLTLLGHDLNWRCLCVPHFLADPSKQIRAQMYDIIVQEPECFTSVILPLLTHAKKDVRQIAVNAVITWNDPSHHPCLLKAYEKEKQADIRKAIESHLQMTSAASDVVESDDEYIQRCIKTAQKSQKALLLRAAQLPRIRFATSGKPMPKGFIDYWILSCTRHNQTLLDEESIAILQRMQADDRSALSQALFNAWHQKGCPTQNKWVLYPAALFGGSLLNDTLIQCVKSWSEKSRSAIAAEAVKVLALSDDKLTLLELEQIAQEFRVLLVKAAADSALNERAKQLGMTRDDWVDSLVPDLGLIEGIELDYGARRFQVSLSNTLEWVVQNSEGKVVKNLPAAAKSDDAEKVSAAKAQLSLLKKQLKSVLTLQSSHLERALMTGRKWTKTRWEAAFINNPVMKIFGAGLIWGVYQDDQLQQSFRFMFEGGYSGVDDEEYLLPEDACIGLVHPIELDADLLNAWREHLQDYQVNQPFAQLERGIYYLEQEANEYGSIERFAGQVFSERTLLARVRRKGWGYDEGVNYSAFKKTVEGTVFTLRHSATTGYDEPKLTLYTLHLHGDTPSPRLLSDVMHELHMVMGAPESINDNWRADCVRY